MNGGIVEALVRAVPFAGPAVGAGLEYMKNAVAAAANYQRAAATGVAYGMPYAQGGFGYSPAEAAGMGGRFFGGAAIGPGPGGKDDPTRGLFATALGFSRAGIDMGSMGNLFRGFSSGGEGSFMGKTPSRSDLTGILALAVASGTATGLKNARLGDFMQGLASEMTKLSDKGIGYDLGTALTTRLSLAQGGMEGMQGSALMGNARSAISGAGGQVFNQSQLKPMMTAYFSQKGWMRKGTQREFDEAHQYLQGNEQAMMEFMQWSAKAAGGDEYAYRYIMDMFGGGMTQSDQFMGSQYDPELLKNMKPSDPRKMVKGIPFGAAGHEAGMQWKTIGFGSRKDVQSEVMAMQDLDQEAAQYLVGGLVKIMKSTGLSIENLKELVDDPSGFLQRKASDGFNRALDSGGDALKEIYDWGSGRAPGVIKDSIDSIKGFIGGPPPGPSQPSPPQPRSSGDQSSLMLQTRGGEVIRIELINHMGRPVGARVVDHGELIPS